jgi:hypothetical protein
MPPPVNAGGSEFQHGLGPESIPASEPGITGELNTTPPLYGPEPTINFIAGTNTSITVADNPTNESIDVTIGSGIQGQYNTSSPVYGPEPKVNFIPGYGATITVADNPTNQSIDVTVSTGITTSSLESTEGTYTSTTNGAWENTGFTFTLSEPGTYFITTAFYIWSIPGPTGTGYVDVAMGPPGLYPNIRALQAHVEGLPQLGSWMQLTNLYTIAEGTTFVLSLDNNMPSGSLVYLGVYVHFNAIKLR